MKIFLIAMLCVMCFAIGVNAQNIGDRFAVKGDVIQASPDGKIALIMDDDWNVIHVKSASGELFYDGKKVNKIGKFVGVYSYESQGGNSKTVPSVIFE